jgi:hypothetical protein
MGALPDHTALRRPTNIPGTATRVGTATNNGALFVRTGTPGSVKLYWARTKNTTDDEFSGFANPTLAVFCGDEPVAPITFWSASHKFNRHFVRR